MNLSSQIYLVALRHEFYITSYQLAILRKRAIRDYATRALYRLRVRQPAPHQRSGFLSKHWPACKPHIQIRISPAEQVKGKATCGRAAANPDGVCATRSVRSPGPDTAI